MIAKILTYPDPFLSTVCTAVPLEKISDLRGLLLDMCDTMLSVNGLGLAANQVGRSERLFIMKAKVSEGVFETIECINPEIVSQEDLVPFANEACLSIPGTSGVTKRYSQVHLRWVEASGLPREAVFTDLEAFAVQHEMDHLDGKLYINQMGPLKRDLVMGRHKKYLRALRRS